MPLGSLRCFAIIVAAIGNGASAQAPSSRGAGPSLVGWVSFHGEIMLYRHREDLGRTFDGSCISGRFARSAQIAGAARRFEGRRVRVYGTVLRAADVTADDPSVENYCGSDEVLIARTMVAEPGGR